jgi:spore coat-associated protein N
MATRTRKPGGNSSRVLATLGVLGAIGALATVGTYSLFTSTVSGTQTISSGTVTIALGASGPANRLSVAATNIAPNDTIQRAVNLLNTGTIDLSAVTLTTTATTSSLLDTDATNGLQMVIDRCSVAWTETIVPGGFTYTCSGTTSAVIATRPVIGATIAMPGLSALTAAGTDFLRVTLTLPGTAGNTFQNRTSTIDYAFTATQRAGTNR